MRIAMIQMASASGDVERNISRAFSMMEEAAEKSDLLVLPELWTIGYNFHHFEEHILSRHALLLEKLSDFARTHRVTLSPGTLPIRHGAIIRNTGFLFAPDGKCIAEYSKRHLFQGYLEAQLFRPGDALMQTRIHGIQTGMAVCYEFYFPKMWRKMAKAGTTLVLAPASWPKKHILQWSVLSAARAIENGICICAVNMAGTYKDVVLGGHSRFIDPLGHVLVEAGEGEEICYAEYDEEKYKELGKKLSVVSGVVYGKIIDLCPAQNRIFSGKCGFFMHIFTSPCVRLAIREYHFPCRQHGSPCGEKSSLLQS